MKRNAALVLSLFTLASCGSDDKEPADSAEPIGIAALGAGSHELSNVDEDKIADDDEGLDVPRDLAFNPANPGELWVVNRADDSASIFTNVGTDEQEADHRVDPFALHFMEEVSSIS